MYIIITLALIGLAIATILSTIKTAYRKKYDPDYINYSAPSVWPKQNGETIQAGGGSRDIENEVRDSLGILEVK